MQLITLLFLILTSVVHGEEYLYALIAGDTITDIRNSTRHDMSTLRKTVRIIAKKTPFKLRVKLLKGRDLTKYNLKGWINHIPNNRRDVILIYFSGHGYRTDSMTSPWPNLFLPAKDETFPAEELRQLLLTRKPRLGIILLDCCNNPAKIKFPNFCREKNIPHNGFRGLRSLFLESKGLVIATGSKPGGVSFALDNGSLFTSSFILALKEGADSPKISWETILLNTKALCAPMQHPQASVQLNSIKATKQSQENYVDILNNDTSIDENAFWPGL